jgi:hypothetical protein
MQQVFNSRFSILNAARPEDLPVGREFKIEN